MVRHEDGCEVFEAAVSHNKCLRTYT